MDSDIWKVFDYEVMMYLGTRKIRINDQNKNDDYSLIINNALVESSLLHGRILADIFLSKDSRPDAINLGKLGFANEKKIILEEIIGKFRDVYGSSEKENSICWIINKMLAHPTTHRSDYYDYTGLFNTLDPLIIPVIEYLYQLSGRELPYVVCW